MIIPVKERGEFVATMRHISVRLMETLAAWVPTTPEMEVKLLFGEHIWDVAQHADALGKRTYELRLPLQHSQRPTDDYVSILDELAATTATSRRLAGVYDAMIPAMVERYRAYVDETDPLSDAPTVRILESFLRDAERMLKAGRSLREEHPALREEDPGWTESLRRRAATTECVAARVAGEVA
jgi:hypothetical protein